MSQAAACPRCGGDLPPGAIDHVCPARLRADHEGITLTRGNEPVPPPSIDFGKLFPQLEVLGLLGRGGMGEVHKARQIRLDRLVALKILPPETGQTPAFAARFTREARALAKLNHLSIVGLYDFGDADGLFYFLMEYVNGGNLRTLLKGEALPADRAVAIALQVSDALDYAHGEGVIHRDIKPENLLVDQAGHIKVADFGLAKLVVTAPGEVFRTATQQVMGTWNYMAPEQLERPSAVDHRADIYSLGVVLYEMLTGRLPQGRFPLPSERSGVDKRLDEIVLHALEREPERRFQHVAEFRQALVQVSADGRKMGATAGQRRGFTPAATDRSEVATTSFVAGTPSVDSGIRRRLRYDAIGLVIAAIVNVGFVLFYWYGVGPQNFGHTAIGMVSYGIVLAVQAMFMVCGALNVANTWSYKQALAGCFAAALPIGPGWLIGFPVGLWIALGLRKAKIREAFGSERDVPSNDGVRDVEMAPGYLGSATQWAIFVSVLGVGAVFLPWLYKDRQYGNFDPPWLSYWPVGPIWGFDFRQGKATAIVFALLLFVLVTTLGIRYRHWLLSQTLAILLAGVIVICIAMQFDHASAEFPVVGPIREGVWSEMGFGLALTFLGALQTRSILLRRQKT